MHDGPKRDWEKTWVHFFCGAVVGAGIGLYLDHGILFGLGGAILTGLLAAIFLDRFWETFLEWWR
jgi:hypothetical protein